MNRRDFGKTATLVAAAAVIAPNILAEPVVDQDDWNGPTPEQYAAIERMEENMPPRWIFEKIANDIPQIVPDVTGSHLSWKHGSFRIVGTIGGFSAEDYEWGGKSFEDGYKKIENQNLSDIKYVIFWRQAVRNKYTQKVKYFASWTQHGAISVNPGQTVQVEKYIPLGTSNSEIERIHRESFMKLQEMVVEYHNREAA